MKIQTIIRLLALSLIGLFPVFAQSINGTWFLNGFHTDVNANSSLPVTESITGTATINIDAGSITFDTNLGNWTDDAGFVQSGDTYQMVYPSDSGKEYLIAIRVIDEDTLAFTLSQIWLTDSGFDILGTEGIAGVLTKAQIPAPIPGAWTGDFTAKGMILKEVENDGDALRLQKEDATMSIEANPGGTSFRLVADDPDVDGYADNLIQVGNALDWADNDTSDYVLWSDSFLTTRHVQTRDQVRMLQLADGKIAFFVIYNQRARTVSSYSFLNNIRFISEFEYGSTILVPDGDSVGFAYWTQNAGLSGDDALPGAIPFGDGVPNILKFAFNMNGGGPDSSILTPGGTKGLPAAALDETGESPVWRVEFVRRKGSGLSYTPQKSTSLTSESFGPMTGKTTFTVIDDDWERVVVEEPFDPVAVPSCFTRVEVVLPEE